MVNIRQASQGDIQAMWAFDQVAKHDEKRRESVAEAARAGEPALLLSEAWSRTSSFWNTHSSNAGSSRCSMCTEILGARASERA